MSLNFSTYFGNDILNKDSPGSELTSNPDLDPDPRPKPEPELESDVVAPEEVACEKSLTPMSSRSRSTQPDDLRR